MDKIAKIILFRNNKFLLQLRDNKPNIDYPNTWSLVGGYIEPNETSEEAIIREVEEEISLKLEKVDLVSSKIKTEDDNVEFEENIFSAELPCSIDRLNLNEGREIKLFALKELDKINIRPVFKKTIINFARAKD